MAKYYLKRSDLIDICENREEELANVQSMEAFRAFFSQKSNKGLWLRDIMKKVGVPAQDIPPEKQERLDWIISHVEIEGITEAVPEAAAKNGPEPVPAHQQPAQLGGACCWTLEDARLFFELVDSALLQKAEGCDVTKCTVSDGIPVQYQDKFLLRGAKDIYEGFAVVLRANDHTAAAAASLHWDGTQYHIQMEQGQIDYPLFQNQRKYLLALFPADAAALLEKEHLEPGDCVEYRGVIRMVPCTIEFKATPETNKTLCIDFGTSNTAAGSYGILNPEKSDGIELVSFLDVTLPQPELSLMYPTLVYVDDCRDQANIRYLFGYEARKKLIEKDYDTEASVFFEIKRWIGSLDTEEEIRDEDGFSLTVRRREIVKAYMSHIIDLAEQHFRVRFRKLHLSAPVKQKEQFYREMSAMLQGRCTVLKPGSTVDEGVAIIYNSISRLIERGEIGENEPARIMILDCGGGTTDLASCKIVKQTMDAGTELRIDTQFVNGNSNFGGNNITFRIMQLLKIKLAEKYSPERMDGCMLRDLIPMEESGILGAVEDEFSEGGQYNSDKLESQIYRKFQQAYERAEEIIPTIYTGNPRFCFESDLAKIRRNYYYLWQLAETVKICFYGNDMVSIDLRPDGDKPLEFDRGVMYYLYVAENDGLACKRDAADGIEITINELRRLLCGDIYGLLNELLCSQNFQLDAHKYYRLAGQSCKISMFMDLLKEFIPGRKLRVNPNARSDEDSKGSARLKLDCIRGCIAYIRDKEGSRIHPEITIGRPQLIYDVYASKAGAEAGQPMLSRENPDTIGFELVTQKASHIELVVKNAAGLAENRINVNFEKGEIEVGTLSALFQQVEDHANIEKQALDDLQNAIIGIDPQESDHSDHVRFVFAIPSKEGYGINIYRVLKANSSQGAEYHWWKAILYENFVNESTKSFFDGRR